MKSVLFAVIAAASLACVAGPQAPAVRDVEKMAPQYGQSCDEAAGQILTCTVQCDPGTLGAWERMFTPSLPGVQVCAVRSCTCEQNKPDGKFNTLPRKGFLGQDTSQDVAIVVFGTDKLLGNR